MAKPPLRVAFVGATDPRHQSLLASVPPEVEPILCGSWDDLRTRQGDEAPEIIAVLPGAAEDRRTAPLVPVVLLDDPGLRGDALGAVLLDALNAPRPGPEARLLGESPAALQFRGELVTLSRTEHPLLLTGENGTGKDLAAQVAHQLSARSGAPFLPVNCGAVPAGLAETEFFGCVRGAFTGAENRSGFCQQARGGTLFLDEVGELPLEIQAKLLRVLENHELRRVGCARTEATDFRLVCATNRDLAAEVKAGRFREDLYYRINVLPLRLPALRERKQDLPLLTRHFLSTEAPSAKKPARVAGRSWTKLAAYHWPGNLRQLRNVVVRAAVLHGAEDELCPQHFQWDS